MSSRQGCFPRPTHRYKLQHGDMQSGNREKTVNDSDEPKLESPEPNPPAVATRNVASGETARPDRKQNLAGLLRAGYVIGVITVVGLLPFRVLSNIGIDYNTKLILLAGLVLLTIALGTSYFLLRPGPTKKTGPQNNNDTTGPLASHGSTAPQPLRRLGQGCLFLFVWAVVQCLCWWAITALSWPTRFFPNEIFGGGNQIVIPDAITIAFWMQVFLGLAVPNRYRAFALLQLFVAAFIASRPSFHQQSEFSVSFHVPSYVWAAYWIQLTVLAAAVWRLSFQRNRTLAPPA
ncbi:hypothetical protein NHH03_07220 [Stieleria sp. TO1_6]|uniref:hypothetical protein n=1 Tax=Stieleria tagensis TaxID=2956795 RepID=UPI00209B26AF|nr:hypothetical protein [Stieleria tagensis]MCO8121520.1 hypothetical protein [Stieleria tagensis]